MSDSPNRYVSRPRAQAAGFTIVELLMALAITAVIAVSVVTMMSALAYGSSSRQSMRDLLARGNVIERRINTAARNAREVVDAATDYVVLWVNDVNADDGKQNGEMQLIRRDSATDEILSYTNDVDTTGFANAGSFITLATSSYPSQRWATDISSLGFTLTTGGSGSALLSYRIVIDGEQLTETATGAAAVRN